MPYTVKRISANDDPAAVALGLRSGIVHVEHDEETIARVSDKRGKCAAAVDIYYETTAPEGGGTKPHVVLIPGTGTTTLLYRTGDPEDHFAGRLINSGNYDVTLFDKRGHGLSSVPKGPYTVELLAADVAAVLTQLFPNTKFHLFGTSLGLGTCMAMTLDYPDMVASLNGSGFLFDRTRKDFAAWFFSRPWVIRSLGMRRIAKLTQIALKARNKGIIPEQFKYCSLEGFTYASSSWLNFNRKPDLHKLQTQTFIVVPQYDENIGHRRKFYREEMALMPNGGEGICKLEYVPGFSHGILLENTKKLGSGSEIVYKMFIEQLESLK